MIVVISACGGDKSVQQLYIFVLPPFQNTYRFNVACILSLTYHLHVCDNFLNKMKGQSCKKKSTTTSILKRREGVFDIGNNGVTSASMGHPALTCP
jgi:hypothetical protein